MSVNEKMTAIADTIRAYTDGTEQLGLDQMAQQVQTVYLSGVYDAAYRSGCDDGYAQGGQAQQDAFWDAYQQNGTRTDYTTAFGGKGWTNETFQPKHNITPTNAVYMFRATEISGDLVELLADLGITLDFSNCTNAMELFSNARNITRIGVLDLSKCTRADNAFAYCGVKTIDKLILSADTVFYSFPGSATELENITVEGTLAMSGFNARYCTKLSKASIVSIINTLSTETSGLSVTLSKTAVDNAFGDGVTGSESEEWTALIDTRNNWTISLV